MRYFDDKAIVYVNGFKIRQFLDTDFPMLARFNNDPTYFYPKYYIPETELWIDEAFKSETDFLLKIYQINKEIPYNQRRQYSEGRLVDQQRAFLHKILLTSKIPEFIRKTDARDHLLIKWADGSIIRKYIDLEFMFGGHDLVYSYIPNGEIWLDDVMNNRDKPHVLIHELAEREQMEKSGLNYDEAHEYATVIERRSRRKAGGSYPEEDNYPSEWTRETLLAIFKDLANN